jgi:hypothetical protein
MVRGGNQLPHANPPHVNPPRVTPPDIHAAARRFPGGRISGLLISRKRHPLIGPLFGDASPRC